MSGAGDVRTRPTHKGRPIPPVRHHNKRFDFAVDVLLNSGTLYSYVDAFWQFVDGDDEALERFPS